MKNYEICAKSCKIMQVCKILKNYASVQKSARVARYAKVCNCMQTYAKVWLSMQKCAIEWKSMLKHGQVSFAIFHLYINPNVCFNFGPISWQQHIWHEVQTGFFARSTNFYCPNCIILCAHYNLLCTIQSFWTVNCIITRFGIWCTLQKFCAMYKCLLLF